MLKQLAIDVYVLDVLMRDLVGHDHASSAYLIYLYLWSATQGDTLQTVKTSHQMMAEATGLSKSAVQQGVKRLEERKLVRVKKESVTAMKEYRISRPWRR